MTDSPYLVVPGEKFHLKDRPTHDTGPFADKKEAKSATEANLELLDELQERLYAQAKHALLVVLQAMDTGGKDGTIEHVLGAVNPQGCHVTSFRAPTSLELAHDYLWRIHQAVPPKGMIGIFNRSHYESVLVERVKNLVPRDVWSRRYKQINEFERLLSDEGVRIVKFFLHISKHEQKRRLEARLSNPQKHWKFNPNDLKERERWDDYQQAYEDALRECSTKHAPWYVVPADKKWFRNWVVSDVLVRTLKGLKMEYPPPPPGLDRITVE
ncbi:MAG TPA: polyphosphate kinase 2 family protein [Tepidisphaeraceae bacterium]|nr:polyphosphate kinase 2 family protein [Tepidisphaeraceae bacterium]